MNHELDAIKGTSKNTVSGGQVVNQGEFLLLSGQDFQGALKLSVTGQGKRGKTTNRAIRRFLFRILTDQDKRSVANSMALTTNYDQLTMAYGFWKSGMADKESVFHLFFRRASFNTTPLWLSEKANLRKIS